jgi:hypothetical protein
MKMRYLFVAVLNMFLTGMMMVGETLAADAKEFIQAPISLKAEDVLPANLLKGKNYFVEESVQNDGLINTYLLNTLYGPLKVESTTELVIRVGELNALSAMVEMDQKKVFGDALVAGVKAPVQGIAGFMQDPVNMTKGVVKGTERFFSNMGRSIVSEDPYQDNALKVALGYDATKRAFAYEFGIDPYSNYEPVVDMLGSIAGASVAGGLGPKTAMAAINYNVMTVLSISGTSEGMRKLVRDNPPGKLLEINSAKLAQMGISKPLADAFLNNYLYNPQEATLLVGEMHRLQGVKGGEAFLAVANLASGRSEALLYRVMARMMAGYHTQVSPVESIGQLAGTPYLRKKDGTAVLLVPVDFIFLTVEV